MGKLTDQNKIDVVQKYLTGEFSYSSIAREYSVTPRAIRMILLRRGVKINSNQSELQRKYSLNEHYFDTIDTEEKAYFLGLLYADGCNCEERNRVTLGLQARDVLIIEKLKVALDFGGPINIAKISEKNPKHQDKHSITFISSIISKQLAKLGCFARKSLTLKFPTEEQVPSYLMNHFIRGYFDGNGSIGCYSSNKTTVCSYVSTEQFCKSFSQVIYNNLGFYGSIIHHSSMNDLIYGHNIGGNGQSLKFLSWLYKDATVYLERKWQKTLQCVESVRGRGLSSIKYWTLDI